MAMQASRCAVCFHPRAATGAVCSVCSAAPTSPFASPPPAQQPAAALFGPPTGAISFGAVPPSPSPFGTQAPATSGSNPFIWRPAPTPRFFGDTPLEPFGSVLAFDDDEETADDEPPALDGRNDTTAALVTLEMHCERAAVARGEAVDNFAVLVHAKAPPPPAAGRARAPVDLVAVLDVSGSMQGNKLALVKDAMGFVVDKLSPADRLSVVAFSDSARRVLPLARMSDAGRASAKLAVESLHAGGSTNIRDGLAVAAKVLDGRRQRNAVAAVILLSDGQDSFTRSYQQDLVPRSLMAASSDGGDRGRSSGTPVHAFGFGADHDAAAMHAIAEATAGGTFSFIENQAVVQDAFAQCIGGILSVAAQEVWLALACPAHRSGARVRAVKSGRYASRVVAYGRAAEVDVGELYADEERRFLVFLDVPRMRTTPAAGAGDDDDEGDVTTRLLKVNCTYKDAATGRSMEVAGDDAVLRRPAAAAEDEEPSKEVEVERFRVEAAEDMAAARAAAERGDHGEAARILNRRQDALRRSRAAAGDPRCAALAWELRELAARVASRAEYERSGRAFAFAGASAHAQQRASPVSLFGAMAPFASPGFASAPFTQCGTPAFGAAAGPFATPAMRAMVDESREKRQQQPAAPAPTTRS